MIVLRIELISQARADRMYCTFKPSKILSAMIVDGNEFHGATSVLAGIDALIKSRTGRRHS